MNTPLPGDPGGGWPRHCSNCRALELEADVIAELSANQSAALEGHLQPGMPYRGKPAAPVEEALRFRRALWHACRRKLMEQFRGLADVEESDVQEEMKRCVALAGEEIKVIYAPEGPKP